MFTAYSIQAIWKHLFAKSSASEKGTLSQLKVLLNHAGSLEPDKNMKGCEDFLTVILHAHVIAAVNKLQTHHSFGKVEDITAEIVKQFVFFDPDVKVSRSDKVQLYASQVITLLLLWYAFNDAVKEGNGDRVLRY